MRYSNLSKPVWIFLWLLSVYAAFAVGYEWGYLSVLK